MSLLHAPVAVQASLERDHVLVPFSLRVLPITRMALLDFVGDATYRGLEVQRIDDAGGIGQGTVVLMARVDGKIDVYVEPHLNLRAADYRWVAGGLAGIFRTEMPASAFEVTRAGLQIDVRFVLADGRPFELRLHERRAGAGLRFTMLAPAGHGSVSPTFLPVFWLDGISFVRRRGSNIDIRIGDEARPLVRAPIPWRLPRYCATPLLGVWNEEHDGALAAVPTDPGEHHVESCVVEVVNHHGTPAMRALTAASGGRRLAVVHAPPLPSVDGLQDAACLKGRIAVAADDTEVFGGVYRVRRTGDRVDLEVDVTRPWRPRNQNWVGAVMFRLLVFFRTWPTTYRWRAAIDLAAPEYVMTSRWERKPR